MPAREDGDKESPTLRGLARTLGRSGPDPAPDWLITNPLSETELGVIKSGKEAVVSLVEQRDEVRHSLVALKRYVDPTRRNFQNDFEYRSGRSSGNRGFDKAMYSGSRIGKRVRTAMWRDAEFDALSRLWSRGVTVPYPIRLDEDHILLQYLGEGFLPAPRLIDVACDPLEARELFDQGMSDLRLMMEEGIVHADLSPYNILVYEERLWFIDFPQAADLSLNPHSLGFLERDVHNYCKWFLRNNVKCDPGEIFAELVDAALPHLSL